MTLRNRLQNIAAGGCLIVGVLIAAPLSDRNFHGPSYNGAGHAAENQYSSKSAVTHFTPGIRVDQYTYRAICDSPKDREHADLCQQWRVAEAADNQFWLNLAGLILLAGTLIFTAVAARAARDAVKEARNATAAAVATGIEAKRQADVAEQAFKRLERPYLFIKITDTNFLRNVDGGDTAYLTYTLVNYGKVPAILRSVAVALQDNPTFPLMSPLAIENRSYSVIGPGDEHARGLVARVADGEPGKRYRGQAATLLILHGYIDYDDPSGVQYHDRVCMRGLTNAKDFQIEGGDEHNTRTSHGELKPS